MRGRYRECRTHYTETRAAQVAIGERRRPQPGGRPGYLRVDTAHEGDQDGIRGYMALTRSTMSPNGKFVGSEFIDDSASGLLKRLLIEQAKSRARKSNGNGLVESKNGEPGERRAGAVRVFPPGAQSPEFRPDGKNAQRYRVRQIRARGQAQALLRQERKSKPRAGAPWKCRSVENAESQTQFSQGFPPPWESQLRFPHPHRADDFSFLFPNRTQKPPKEPNPAPADLRSFRLFHGIENACKGSSFTREFVAGRLEARTAKNP